jgi:hypothetical protein
MIQLAEDIDGYDARKVPIDPSLDRLLIEVASTRRMDIAVIDAPTAKKFDQSDTGDDVSIDWIIENSRQHDFLWERPRSGRGERYYLLFWNAYDDETATVAYKFTTLPPIT